MKNSAGSLTYETKLDTKGFQTGLSKLSKVGKTGFSIISTGLTAITGAAIAGTTAFLALGEATQDTVEDMGKLETAFTTAGFSSDTAKKSFEGMVGILGETDQSVEAVNHLAQLTDSEEELAKWTNIAAGVYATFGDSLPLEGLTEAANETAKVGEVTGPLADALNWAGVSEDKFNESLAQCNSEQERATLITQTLSEIYEEAGNTYSEVNKDLIEARKATANFNVALSELGKLATPITTSLKNAFSSAVTSIIPDLQLIIDGFYGVFNDTQGAEKNIQKGISNIINKAIDSITENAPKILESFLIIIESIIKSLNDNAPKLIQTFIEILVTLSESIIEMLPMFLNLGITLLTNLMLGIGQAVPQLIPQIINVLITMITTLTQNLPMIISTGIDVILALIEGILEALPNLIAMVPEIISNLVLALTDPSMIIKLQTFGPKVMLALAKALVKSLPTLLTVIPQITFRLLKGFKDRIQNTDWKSLGKNVLKGILDGMLDFGNVVKNTITKVGKKITKAIKDFFGIKSPSKLMKKEVGQWIPKGIAVGIDDNTDSIMKSINTMNDEVISKMRQAVAIETGNINANAKLTSSVNNNSVIQINAKFDGNVEMDTQKVGRIVTPVVSKTLKTVGVR